MTQRRISDENDHASSFHLSDEQYQTHQQAIGLLLWRLRRMSNCSQSDLALRAETDPSYMSQVERGNGNISVRKLILFGGALNIGEEKLFHMSNQIKYSAQLNEARSVFIDEHTICAERMGQKDSQMIKGSETEPLPENRKATPYS